MRFEVNGDTFRLVFEHKMIPKWVELYISGVKALSELTRSETKAVLYKRGKENVDRPGTFEWNEVSHAGVRQYFKDEYSREEARKHALRRLTKHINVGLRPYVWQAYLDRFDPTD